MSMTRLLVLVVPLALLGACKSAVSPATDCAYDKTAAAAPGYQLCTTSPVIQSAVTSGEAPDHMNPALPYHQANY
jgi:hypothetical protein